jgi:hypothetical protein
MNRMKRERRREYEKKYGMRGREIDKNRDKGGSAEMGVRDGRK